MALVNCPECKSPISDSAKKCPHCGYPLKKSNNNETLNGAFKILLTLIVIAGCAWGLIGIVNYYKGIENAGESLEEFYNSVHLPSTWEDLRIAISNDKTLTANQALFYLYDINDKEKAGASVKDTEAYKYFKESSKSTK